MIAEVKDVILADDAESCVMLSEVFPRPSTLDELPAVSIVPTITCAECGTSGLRWMRRESDKKRILYIAGTRYRHLCSAWEGQSGF